MAQFQRMSPWGMYPPMPQQQPIVIQQRPAPRPRRRPRPVTQPVFVPVPQYMPRPQNFQPQRRNNNNGFRRRPQGQRRANNQAGQSKQTIPGFHQFRGRWYPNGSGLSSKQISKGLKEKVSDTVCAE
uniref:Uncharacterized protein n=1 Tax=Hainan hebius popei arterivirus TaxID=2116439 RepID=A0A2P1GNK0_9NIDO|nr:hypothetical protein [Hainan hebius popei arterivirus]